MTAPPWSLRHLHALDDVIFAQLGVLSNIEAAIAGSQAAK
jgi:hypothetical protein